MKQNKVYQAPQMVFQQLLLEDIVTASATAFSYKNEGGYADAYDFRILFS